MSTSVTSVVSHFPSAQNGFTTTLASTISSGAATVPLNSVAGYTNGQVAVFVVDPTASTKQTFTGIVDTAGVQITSVVWTAGTNVAHSGGSTVVDYFTATHISMMTKGILVHSDQDGTLKAGAVDNAAVLASDVVTTAKILDSNVTTAKLASSAVTSDKVATGMPVQVAMSITGALATGTTLIPNDDTIPQSTEGDQYLSLAFTPKSATNRLLIEVKLQTSHSSSTIDLVAALFQDSGTGAIAGGWVTQGSTTFKNIIMIGHDMVAGTTSATTFKVRAGANGAGTLTINGSGGGRILGGVLTSYIKITEYKA